MAKEIRYKMLSAESPDVEQNLLNATLICKTQADYDANYPIAEKEAIPGTIEVSGEFDPEPEPPETGDDSAVWDELDAAYQEGYEEGYTEGVNSAYDQ